MPAKQWTTRLALVGSECAALDHRCENRYTSSTCDAVAMLGPSRKVVERQINSVSRELRPRYRVGFLFSDAGNPVTAGREPKDEVLVSRSIGGPLVALRFINWASGTTLTKPAVSKSLRVGALTLLVSCCALEGVGSSRTPISLRSDSVAVPLRPGNPPSA